MAIETVLAAIGGSLAALLVGALIDPQGKLAMDGFVVVGGAFVGMGLTWWLRY